MSNPTVKVLDVQRMNKIFSGKEPRIKFMDTSTLGKDIHQLSGTITLTRIGVIPIMFSYRFRFQYTVRKNVYGG